MALSAAAWRYRPRSASLLNRVGTGPLRFSNSVAPEPVYGSLTVRLPLSESNARRQSHRPWKVEFASKWVQTRGRNASPSELIFHAAQLDADPVRILQHHALDLRGFRARILIGSRL